MQFNVWLLGQDDTATGSGVASWLRFIEYSFSAAVMIVAIALQVGIVDAWMLFTLAALTWAGICRRRCETTSWHKEPVLFLL